MSTTRNKLPGFGRALDYIPDEGTQDYTGPLFGNGLSSQYTIRLLTLRELTVLHLINTITDKPDWHLKVNDEAIVRKWRDEATSSGHDITPKMLDWSIAEVRHLAAFVPQDARQAPPIIVYNGEVVKSDTAISQELHQSLIEAVSRYETSIPEWRRDWHPNTDDKVWDLVHPSMYPLAYGATRVLVSGRTNLDDCVSRCGEGTVAVKPKLPRGNYYEKSGYSKRFQWLPCEVDITGADAKITSNINNLHPSRDQTLYGLVEQLITASIPLWEITLAPLRDSTYEWEPRIQYRNVDYDSYNPWGFDDTTADGPQWNPTSFDKERQEEHDPNYANKTDYYEQRKEWVINTRGLHLPDAPEAFQPQNRPATFNIRDSYNQLQVIVKLANIMLTPEKPEYNGGVWHVEGQLNEHIVATSLYYHSCSNITASSLSFRQSFNTEDDLGRFTIQYAQYDHDWLYAVYGCHQNDPGVQEVGSVETREGRLLTFPNILQHRVGPFKLADPTKPGHRKIVALFLVDPNIKITSTAHVPCQRQDWWWDAVQGDGSSRLASLPRELQDQILNDVDFPISLNEAKRMRDDLMEERAEFVIKNGDEFCGEQVISLCEH